MSDPFSGRVCHLKEDGVYIFRKWNGELVYSKNIGDIAKAWFPEVDAADVKVAVQKGVIPRASSVHFLPSSGPVENYDDVFHDAPDQPINSFTGYRVHQHQSPSSDESVSIKVIYSLVMYLAGGEKAAYEYLLNWIADLFQNPTSTVRVAICHYSVQGTGEYGRQ
jgi:hypothetical protein